MEWIQEFISSFRFEMGALNGIPMFRIYYGHFNYFDLFHIFHDEKILAACAFIKGLLSIIIVISTLIHVLKTFPNIIDGQYYFFNSGQMMGYTEDGQVEWM